MTFDKRRRDWAKYANDLKEKPRKRLPKVLIPGILIYDQEKKGFIYKSNKVGGTAYTDTIKNPCPLVEGSKVQNKEYRSHVAPRQVSVMECVSCEYNRMVLTPEGKYFVACAALDFHIEQIQQNPNFTVEQASVADQWRTDKLDQKKR